jgi:3'(2'), 5'-bisphosphate nucleotidase
VNSPIDFKQVLEVALTSSIQASRAIIAIRNSGFKVDQKSDLSPVTEADELANAIITKDLKQLDWPIMSEESAIPNYTERKLWTRYWCVDPLDGTKEFIHNRNEFAVNIALIENNQPVLGILALPASEKLYWGGPDLGVFQTSFDQYVGNPLNSNYQLNPFDGTRAFAAVVSRSHLNKQTLDHIEGMKIIHPDIEVIRAGSSTKFCELLENRADVYPRFSPCMEWDTAAGDALMRAVGKGVFTLNSQERIRYNKQSLINPSFIVR